MLCDDRLRSDIIKVASITHKEGASVQNHTQYSDSKGKAITLPGKRVENVSDVKLKRVLDEIYRQPESEPQPQRNCKPFIFNGSVGVPIIELIKSIFKIVLNWRFKDIAQTKHIADVDRQRSET